MTRVGMGIAKSRGLLCLGVLPLFITRNSTIQPNKLFSPILSINRNSCLLLNYTTIK